MDIFSPEAILAAVAVVGVAAETGNFLGKRTTRLLRKRKQEDAESVALRHLLLGTPAIVIDGERVVERQPGALERLEELGRLVEKMQRQQNQLQREFYAHAEHLSGRG